MKIVAAARQVRYLSPEVGESQQFALLRPTVLLAPLGFPGESPLPHLSEQRQFSEFNVLVGSRTATSYSRCSSLDVLRSDFDRG